MGQKQSSHLYSVPFTDPKSGETPIMRNALNPTHIKEYTSESARTLQATIEDTHSRLKDEPFVGWRDPSTNKFVYRTYGEEYQEARKVGSTILKLKLQVHDKESKNINHPLQIIGVHSQNRPEWNTIDMASALYGITLVPLYDTLGPDTISYILNQTQMKSCFCSAKSIQSILSTNEIHQLDTIITLDVLDEETLRKIQHRKITLLHFKDFIKETAILPLPTNVEPDTIFTFSYTSGTTGPPKGAMLTHKNFVSITASLEEINFNKTDYILCYLPLPHVMQRLINVACWATGAKIAFFGGDMLKLKDDIQAVKPTIFISVPRLFNKFYDAINDNLSTFKSCKGGLIQAALRSKQSNLKSNGQLTHFLYDKIVFNKIRDIFGGRIRILGTGSAPLSAQVMDFFKVVLSCPFIEAYGQTEGCGLQFLTSSKDINSSGNVGGIQQNLEMKLVDVPEMNYFSTDKDDKGQPLPRGEICVRGAGVFAGYYKDEEKTKEAKDEQGFLHSGDIGCILPNGALKIIDRKKNIFKLSQGEYVAPEKVENIYLRARGVDEVFVHGDSMQNYCVGVIVPNPIEIKKIAQELQVDCNLNITELCKNKAIIQFYEKTIFEHGKTNKLFTFEQATKIHLEPTSFGTLGLCTSTMKLQRFQAKQHYIQILNNLYSQQNPK